MATSINCSDSDKCLACSEDAEPQPFEEEKVLEEMLDAIEEKTNEAFIAHISHEGVLHRALKLAAGVRKLIDIGGGNLRLADGSVWRLFPACAGCENADRMKVDTNRHSKYCPRCANQKLRDHG